jgi:hypothetical protein
VGVRRKSGTNRRKSDSCVAEWLPNRFAACKN